MAKSLFSAGTSPREAYLGDTVIYYRVLQAEAEQLAHAESFPPPPGIPLYTF